MVGSFHLWIARHLYSFRPRHVLYFERPMTLGVALPWGIAARGVWPAEKILSISGDGGFFMELETAVRLKADLSMVWGGWHLRHGGGPECWAKYGRTSGGRFWSDRRMVPCLGPNLAVHQIANGQASIEETSVASAIPICARQHVKLCSNMGATCSSPSAAGTCRFAVVHGRDENGVVLPRPVLEE